VAAKDSPTTKIGTPAQWVGVPIFVVGLSLAATLSRRNALAQK